MDEFNRIAWELERARGMQNIYPCDPMLRESPPLPPPPHRWTVGTILGGLLMVGIGGFLIWGGLGDLAEHFKPAQPAPVQEETRPDVTEQIRTLERMISEAKQLNVEINAVHDSIKQNLAAQTR